MTAATGATRTERKRSLILLAAKDVFAREGYSQAGMEQIARDAGVSTATLYAHFPSKAELFRVVVEATIDDHAVAVRRSTLVEGAPRERLEAFATVYAAFYCDPTSRALFRMVTAEHRRFPGIALHFRERGRAELGSVAVALVRDLAARGELRVEKPSRAAGQLQGMIEHATLMLGLVEGDEVQPSRSPAEIAADAVETFLARYGA
ncbi:MAG: TetR/AcrR family transcriptional regulator [Caulobacter sp.]|nr:TetR/AcrR family transcriptional regulator [Caulobacter sp.]